MTMDKIVHDLRTRETAVVQLTPEEEADAQARTQAEQNDPRRIQAAIDKQAVDAARADNTVQYLVNHTPAECYQYVQDNVTNLAQAKEVLGRLAMAISALARNTLR